MMAGGVDKSIEITLDSSPDPPEWSADINVNVHLRTIQGADPLL